MLSSCEIGSLKQRINDTAILLMCDVDLKNAGTYK